MPKMPRSRAALFVAITLFAWLPAKLYAGIVAVQSTFLEAHGVAQTVTRDGTNVDGSPYYYPSSPVTFSGSWSGTALQPDAAATLSYDFEYTFQDNPTSFLSQGHMNYTGSASISPPADSGWKNSISEATSGLDLRFFVLEESPFSISSSHPTRAGVLLLLDDGPPNGLTIYQTGFSQNWDMTPVSGSMSGTLAPGRYRFVVTFTARVDADGINSPFNNSLSTSMDYSLQIGAVPEPSTFCFGALALFTLGYRRIRMTDRLASTHSTSCSQPLH